jgi:putative DNA primase/helicase
MMNSINPPVAMDAPPEWPEPPIESYASEAIEPEPKPEPADPIQSLRAKLFDAGFRPIPLYSWDHTGPSPGKRPLGSAWQIKARQPIPFCVTHPSVPHAENTGILCDGLRAIDIDVDDPDRAGRVKSLAIQMLGDAPMRYRANSPRVLLVYRAASGEPEKKALAGSHGKVEVLGRGQQFAAYGTHETGAALEWQGGLVHNPLETLPAITETAVAAFLAAAAPMIGADAPKATPDHQAKHAASQFGPSADPLDIAAALAVIPNNGPADWDCFNKIGMATWHASGGSDEGYAAWSAWSGRHPLHDAAQCRARWQHYLIAPPGTIGAGTLFHLAKEARPGWKKPTDNAPPPHGAAEPWPDPIPLPTGLPPVAPFDEALLPAAFRPWVMDIANRMQCPPDFPAVAAIVTASAIIGRQIGIHPKRRDDWLVVPNLWGAVVGRPSLMKTPALAESRKILQRLEIASRKAFDAAMAEYELAGSIGKLIAKERTKGAAKAIKGAIADGADAKEAARTALQPATADEATAPVRRRYVTQDPTVEKLGELLTETPRGMLIFRDELIGLLRSMDKDGHENDRGFYLEAWNGTGAYTYDRIARGTLEIDAACVSILGGIQPGPLRSYISQANQGGAGDDGLLQRIQLLVWPDRGDEWVNVDEWPDTVAKNNVFDIMERLDRISPNDTGADIPSIRFDDVAQHVFNTWREAFERRFITEDMPPALEAHLTKYRSLLPSLALIFHLIDTPDAEAVGVQHVNRAAAWLVYLETHARRLYAQILDPGTVAAIALSARLPELPDPFTTRDIYRRHWVGLDRPATEKAIEVLLDLYYLRAATLKTDGRPTTSYSKNPAIKNTHTPKGCSAKSDKSPSDAPFGTFGTDPNEGGGENFSDEVTF